MTQLSLIPPDITRGTWSVYAPAAETNETEAAAEFRRRYGQPPQHIIDRPEFGLARIKLDQLWLGPIPKIEA